MNTTELYEQYCQPVHTTNEHLHATGGLVIPHEVSDGITLANLKDCRAILQSQLDAWTANPKDEMNPTGYWLHPDDVVGNMKYIRAMDVLIGYYGG